MTVTELNAMASPANAGSNVIPKVGYKTPAAIGIKIVLYAKAQNMFSFILRERAGQSCTAVSGQGKTGLYPEGMRLS